MTHSAEAGDGRLAGVLTSVPPRVRVGWAKEGGEGPSPLGEEPAPGISSTANVIKTVTPGP